MPSQVVNGKAFEWVLASAFADRLGAKVNDNSQADYCQTCYAQVPAPLQARFRKNAGLAVEHIVRFEKLEEIGSPKVRIQFDDAGQAGDVRDVVLEYAKRSVGVSCKNNHSALKHSRLSDSIDFVRDWGLDSKGCSSEYWDRVRPVFERLREMRGDGLLWRGLAPDDKKAIYWEILHAFADELSRVMRETDGELGPQLIGYLIGRQDFYKVVSRPRAVEVFGFNFFGTLSGTSKTRMPDSILGIDDKNGGTYSKTVRFSHGFTVNFRIHNASSRVEPSLKFDIKALAWPERLHRQIIMHG